MGDLMPGRTPIAKSMTKNANKQKQTVTNDPSEWTKQQFSSQSQGILDTINRYNTESPFQSYTGPMVAGLSGNETRAREIANSSVGQNEGILGDSGDLIRRAAETNWTPEQVAGPREVSYRTFESFNPETYYNPFEQEVVDAAGAYYDEQLGRQVAANQARATQRGAYGGSRHGVADAELQRTSQMDRAQMMADLRYRGYETARDQFNADSAGLYQADRTNADWDYNARQNQATRNDAAAQSNRENLYRGASEMQDLAAFRTADTASQVQMLEQLGATEREIAQAQLDADRAEFDREAADRLQRFLIELQARQGILGATPGGAVQTTQGMTAGDYINGAGTVMSGIGSIMGGVGGMMSGGMGSDRRLKRNIVPLGKRGPYNWYSFSYIWEPEDAAPHEGVMAQEVAAINPAAVFNMGGGYLGVNYDLIAVDIAAYCRNDAAQVDMAA